MLGLFDGIHDNAIHEGRCTPATLTDFVKFGLSQSDYVQYIGLQLRLQGELIHGMDPECGFLDYYNNLNAVIEELADFCIGKKIYGYDGKDAKSYLTSKLRSLDRFDAIYLHEDIQFAMEPDEFRLKVERKLSLAWDKECEYLFEVFNISSYEHTYMYNADNEPIETICFKRFDPVTKSILVLDSREVRILLGVSLRECQKIEAKIKAHLALIPTGDDVFSEEKCVQWVKILYELYNRQEIAEGVHERIEEIFHPGFNDVTSGTYAVKEADELLACFDSSHCRNPGHIAIKILVNFSFPDGSKDLHYVNWCIDCRQFLITYEQLVEISREHGRPVCKIIYPFGQEIYGEDYDFSDFAETSIFYDMGYTVSQSAGLTAQRRQAILKHAIESGKASKQQVLRFLEQRININGMKDGNELALRKWQEDYDYVRKLGC